MTQLHFLLFLVLQLVVVLITTAGAQAGDSGSAKAESLDATSAECSERRHMLSSRQTGEWQPTGLTCSMETIHLRKGPTSIKAQFPQLKGVSDADIREINQKVKALVMKEIDAFKTNIPATYPRNCPVAQENEFELRSHIMLLKNNLISIRFAIFSYIAPFAHPAHWSRVFNYQIHPACEISLESVFDPGKPYLSTISDIAIKSLSNHLKAEERVNPDLGWIRKGAGARLENFQRFNFTERSLEFVFDEYTVAPYAAGAQMVVIDYARIKALMNRQSPVFNLAAAD